MIGLICLHRVSVSIFSYIPLAWPELLSKNKIKNTLAKKRGKMKIINVLERDLNSRLKETVCSSLITNFFPLLVDIWRNSFSVLTSRTISVLKSDDLLTSHRRWLLLWICALELIVREAKKELMKKIVHELYLYRVFSFYFHLIERQNDGNFVNVR